MAETPMIIRLWCLGVNLELRLESVSQKRCILVTLCRAFVKKMMKIAFVYIFESKSKENLALDSDFERTIFKRLLRGCYFVYRRPLHYVTFGGVCVAAIKRYCEGIECFRAVLLKWPLLANTIN